MPSSRRWARATAVVFAMAVAMVIAATESTAVVLAQDDRTADAAADAAVSLSSARSGHSATLLDDGRVLIAGGFDGDAELASVDIVDPVNGVVAPLMTMSSPRAGHSATLLSDGRVLVAGGRADGASLATAELIDPATGQSTTVGPMRWARADHTGVALADGRVMLVGGVDGADPVARAEIFDPVSSTFSKVTKSKATHLGSTASVLPDGRVLVTGDVSKRKAKAAERFDPRKGKWVALQGATKRSDHTSTSMADGRVLLAGGVDGDAPLASAQVFDPGKATFTSAGDLTTPRFDHTATLLADGRVAVVGGTDGELELASIELFDPGTGKFADGGTTGLPRIGHTATLLADGRVLLAGGEVAGLALDDVVIYDPNSASVISLDGTPVPAASTFVAADDTRSRASIRAQHGPPDAFAIHFYDEVAPDGSVTATTLERWTYYGDGVEYVFAGDDLLSAEPVELASGGDVEPAPYDPDQFSAYASLDEVVAAAGVEEYLGGPVDDLVDGGELYVADRLIWGMKDGELRYVEAVALEAPA